MIILEEEKRGSLFQDEETSLQKLNLSDCKLKTDLNNVINALGSNQCLQVRGPQLPFHCRTAHHILRFSL